jgi:hypothetical protein
MPNPIPIPKAAKLLRLSRISLPMLVLSVNFVTPASACLPSPYERLTRHCVPEASYTQLLSVFFGELSKPRQIAVIAGAAQYPNLAPRHQLPPADHDVEALSTVLIQQLKFDEVLVLKNNDFNRENLRYLFEIYLPDALQRNPKSRVVFSFSGHGSDFQDTGYIFFPSTKTIDVRSYDDLVDAIDMSVMKSMMVPTIRHAQHFLALINACNGGYFLDPVFSFGEAGPLEEKGAHGITAGGSKDVVHAFSNVGEGKGSVFFEIVIAALKGTDVTLNGERYGNPSRDGMLSATTLADYLIRTIRVIENYSLSPHLGSLMPPRSGSRGEFFFVTDYDQAKTALSRKFPREYGRAFGASQPISSAGMSDPRDPGLYARRTLSVGAVLNADMFNVIAASQERSNAAGPISFAEDVQGSCLEYQIDAEEKLTWNHLRLGCMP